MRQRETTCPVLLPNLPIDLLEVLLEKEIYAGEEDKKSTLNIDF